MNLSLSMPLRKSRNAYVLAAGLLLVASALAYLPNLVQATVYKDDWYYVLDRTIGGAGVFQAMFSIDRPARGPFFELYYQLFGVTPLPYHLASYLWRFSSGLAALWLFRLLWPRQPRATLWMALLFVLFPGYLRWMEGIEDQPRIASLCLEALSFALTLKAIASGNKATKLAAWTGSILTGWAYLALLDFGIGMEVFRFLCVFVYIDSQAGTGTLLRRMVATLKAWSVAAVIPAGFLFWRLFIFHNERPQTDVGRQLGAIVASPFATALSWLISLVQSTADVSIFSWLTPVVQQYFSLSLRSVVLGGVLAAASVAALYLFDRLVKDDEIDAGTGPATVPPDRWNLTAMTIALLGILVGVIPVVLANRHVDFQSFSHYALPASLAAAVFIIALVFSLKPSGIRVHAVAVLVACAVLAHFAYSSGVVEEEKTISLFWQQVAWRAPGIRQGTTLFVSYPGVEYGENVDAANGPANFIYFPQQTNQIPATYQIMSLPQTPKTTTDVLTGRDRQTGYRTHIGSFSFERLLVLSQPTPSSCVHVLNGQSPLFSGQDTDQVRVIGLYSRIENVESTPAPQKPAEFMFGPEPDHRWCYYFEKADLAAQSADWKQVADIGAKVTAAGLHPEDWVEWTPFLQAYAVLSDEAQFVGTAHRLNGDPFARLQACTVLTRMQSSGQPFTTGIRAQMDALLCHGE